MPPGIFFKVRRMTNGNNRIRTELERKFEAPVDIMVDPSLLVARKSFDRLSDSTVLDSQTQATLGRIPTEPRIGGLYVPATFCELLKTHEQLEGQNTTAWNYFRRTAAGTSPEAIVGLLDENDIDEYADETPELFWKNALSESHRQDELIEILGEEFSFVKNGGIILSRTPVSVETLRDAGTPTIDVGKAKMNSDLHDTLHEVGFENPANAVFFALSNADATVGALVDSILAHNSDLILYRLGI